MDRSKLTVLFVGLLVCVLIALSGFAVQRHWIDAVYVAPVDGFLAFALLTVRSWLPTPSADQKKPPSVPPLPTIFMMIVVAITVFWTVFIAGCGPSAQGARSPARDYARATLILVSEATKAADGVCADLAKQKSDAKLAKTCADAYDATRASLLAAQSIVDGWEAADQKSYACTLAHGVQSLGSMTEAVKAAGGKVPPVIVDALTLGGSFVKGCGS